MLFLKTIPLKYWLILAALIALTAFVYMWRGEIIKGAENAYTLLIAQKQNEQTTISKKESDNVRKEEQVMDSTTLATSLCGLGIVQQNSGC